MFYKFRPWLFASLAATMVAVLIPKEMNAIDDLIYTASALTVPDDPALVTHDQLAVNYENHFTNWTLIDGRGTSTVSVTTDDPWSVSTSESPHFEGYLLDKDYIIDPNKNFSISDVNVSTCLVERGRPAPNLGAASNDHQRWNVARSYRLTVRAWPLRS